MPFDQSDLRTEARGARRTHQPRGARADHNQVIAAIGRGIHVVTRMNMINKRAVMVVHGRDIRRPLGLYVIMRD